jgi:hypothetical protein
MFALPRALPFPARRFLDRLQRVVPQEAALLDGPVEEALDGDDGVAAAALPAVVFIEPFGKGERREGGGRGGAEALDEGDAERIAEQTADEVGLGLRLPRSAHRPGDGGGDTPGRLVEQDLEEQAQAPPASRRQSQPKPLKARLYFRPPNAPSAYNSVMWSARRPRASLSNPACRRQAQANSRNLRSEDRPRRKSSIGPGSAQESHVASSTRRSLVA